MAECIELSDTQPAVDVVENLLRELREACLCWPTRPDEVGRFADHAMAVIQSARHFTSTAGAQLKEG